MPATPTLAPRPFDFVLATASDAMPHRAHPGARLLVSETGREYVFDGSVWCALAPSQPRGATLDDVVDAINALRLAVEAGLNVSSIPEGA